MITRIYYSVQNGGDGSAYPAWMESEELAELDQDYMGEVWGEPCIGWISIEHDTPIKIRDSIATVDGEIKEVENDLNQDYMKKYKVAGQYPDWLKRLEGKLKALKELKAKQETA